MLFFFLCVGTFNIFVVQAWFYGRCSMIYTSQFLLSICKLVFGSKRPDFYGYRFLCVIQQNLLNGAIHVFTVMPKLFTTKTRQLRRKLVNQILIKSNILNVWLLCFYFLFHKTYEMLSGKKKSTPRNICKSNPPNPTNRK